jgi:uncharacterized protein YcgI (DUF1989 family)
MAERIPTAPSRLVICSLKTCRWVGTLGEADLVGGLAYCPRCSCACDADTPCDEPVVIHIVDAVGSNFDPLAITK